MTSETPHVNCQQLNNVRKENEALELEEMVVN